MAHAADAADESDEPVEPPLARIDGINAVWGVYVRCMALTLAFVHLDLSVQVLPLIGAGGVLPAAALMAKVRAVLPDPAARFLQYPTLCHLDCGDGALWWMSVAGGLLALAAASGELLPRTCMAMSVACLVSLFVVGGDFLQFVHDYLLIEGCVLAVCLPPALPLLGLLTPAEKHSSDGKRDGAGRWRWGLAAMPNRIEWFAQRWLVFRLMFSMGVEKLPFVNGSPSWANMTYVLYGDVCVCVLCVCVMRVYYACVLCVFVLSNVFMSRKRLDACYSRPY